MVSSTVKSSLLVFLKPSLIFNPSELALFFFLVSAAGLFSLTAPFVIFSFIKEIGDNLITGISDRLQLIGIHVVELLKATFLSDLHSLFLDFIFWVN